jgi:hypothetical protein
MRTKAMKTRLGYLLAAAVVVLALSSISRRVSAAEGAFIVVPGEASRYSGQQGREGDFTELLATADETGRTYCERARRGLCLHSSQYSAHVPEHRDGARCITGRCDARWARKDVRGAARRRCRHEPEADGKAPHASRGPASSVGSRLGCSPGAGW